MVKERMDLLELLRKGGMDGDVDFLREALRVLVEGIMDAEVSSRISAEYGERSPERVTQRNGYRSQAWDTRVGTMELHIPKLREGSYFPSLLEPRRRSERALLAVIQQAYVEGVSTRRVDDLVKALGCEGISKSQVSRICQELDVVVDGFLGRPLDGGPYPYLWLDALTQKVREDGRIVNVSVVVATAVNGEGKREIIGMDVGTSEDGAFWLAFLRSLSARGRWRGFGGREADTRYHTCWRHPQRIHCAVPDQTVFRRIPGLSQRFGSYNDGPTGGKGSFRVPNQAPSGFPDNVGPKRWTTDSKRKERSNDLRCLNPNPPMRSGLGVRTRGEGRGTRRSALDSDKWGRWRPLVVVGGADGGPGQRRWGGVGGTVCRGRQWRTGPVRLCGAVG